MLNTALILRMLIVATYPFLALSVLILGNAMGFGAAFVRDFIIENRTDQTIFVTPVGTVGERGIKWRLPVKLSRYIALDALQIGHFRLLPGESITILYDFDDVNFSEIVVEDSQGKQRQLVTDPNPTENQYHGPLQKNYVIEDLASLEEVEPDVRVASDHARDRSGAGIVFNLLLVVPWLVYGLLELLARYSLVKVSSKFSSTRDTTVQDAN